MPLATAKYMVEHVNFIPFLEMFMDTKGFVSILAYYKKKNQTSQIFLNVRFIPCWFIPFFTYQIETSGLLCF